MSSNRVALASINTNIDSPKGSPLFKHKSFTASARSSPKIHGPTALKVDEKEPLPLTPSTTPKLTLTKATSSLVPITGSVPPARKTESFSGYHITHGKNVKADLAATKLKLRLQLAFYKLKAQKDSLHARQGPEITVSPTVSEKEPRHFLSAANVNLQKPPRTASGPSLSKVASSKVAKKKPAKLSASSSSLRLYHIKPTSSFHNAYPQQLPLNVSSCGSSSQRLPPVHKILKTPIKTTTRNLVSQFYNNTNNGHSGTGSLSSFHFARTSHTEPTQPSDETIDDSVDDTGIDSRRKVDPIGSSPSRFGTFSTPNSFSVAKSLLQLGSGYY
ncbi:hypothetical_protein [Candidozyma auris]|uniref:hypothetical_protein n=1 Tax=Candidozyma auris TaxID=498019 RepID=UPI000D2AFFD8|nr:hypothetical_protein [[Candida] auris]QEO22849.1 hypothetical_protein [[Candida] auris]GBL48900.1 hypothetical protein CAJCM15448_11740 [[Candida] auris]